MRINIRILAFTAASFAAILFGLAAATSQDEAAALVTEMEKLSSELRRQRERQDSENTLMENRRQLLLEEIETLKDREKELSGRRASLEEEAAKLGETLKGLRAEAEDIEKSGIEMEKLAGRAAASIVNHIGSGLPIGTSERIETVYGLTGSSETPVEELKLLWQLYVQEFRRAGEIELTAPLFEEDPNAPGGNKQALAHTIALEGGAKVQGRILRLGSVGAIFLSDDENTGAVLVGTGEKHVWRQIRDSSVLKSTRRAFAIASGRQAPDLVLVPVQAGGKGGGK